MTPPDYRHHQPRTQYWPHRMGQEWSRCTRPPQLLHIRNTARPTWLASANMYRRNVAARDAARTGTPRAFGNRRIGGFAAAALACALVACTSPSTPAGPASTPAVPLDRPSSTAVDTARQNALAAYRGMWRAYADAGATGATSSPNLTRYTSGEALDALRVALRSIADGGLVLRGEAVPHPQVQQLSPPAAPTTAVIVDCLDDRNFKRVKASSAGAPFSDSPGGYRHVTATVTAVNGTWKVTVLQPGGVGTCQPG